MASSAEVPKATVSSLRRRLTGGSSATRFFAQISDERLLWIIVLLLAIGGSVAADLASDWWDAAPFATNVVSSVLLLGLTVMLVDEFLSFRAAQAWDPVAAFALEDLGRVSRAVWVRLASFLRPEPEAIGVDEYRAWVASARGRSEQRTRMIEIAEDAGRLNDLYEVLHETADGTRELLVRWAPTLVPRAPLAGYLSEFSRLHRRIVEVLGVLHVGQHKPLPITPAELTEDVLAIATLAEALDRRFFAEAAATDPV